MIEEVKAVEVIETTAEVEEKKTRKPREKVRSVEECFDLPVSKLSDKEKNNLINSLKESLTLAVNQAEAYKQNAASAYEQTRQQEEQYKAMEKYYRDKLKYVDIQLAAFHTAINQAIKGGVE
ncbi:MAG: hypothetical protein J6Y02_15295 [Pseudobutyrivibrio sp.]|nr:hypothetical protein [Pseudobutyrivibrio sp.]